MLGGVVFSLSLDSFTGDCLVSLDLFLPNMVARLVDDFVFFGLLLVPSSSRARPAFEGCFSFDFSSFLASARRETVLSVFWCRLFFGLAPVSCDLRGDGGYVGVSLI